MIDPLHPVIWIPSPNFGSRHGMRPVAIVDHVMAGTLHGTDAWFQNPSSQVSAHYGVGKDGEIHKYVNDADAAWHAGLLHSPTAAILQQYPQANPNWYTIGIEHEGQPGDVFPDVQYEATLWLHQQIIVAYGVLIDRVHILGHCEFDSVNRPHCPGPTFPWDRLMAALTA